MSTGHKCIGLFHNKKTGKLAVHYHVRYYEGRGKNRKRRTLPGAFTRKHDAEVAMSRMLAEQAAGTFGVDAVISPAPFSPSSLSSAATRFTYMPAETSDQTIPITNNHRPQVCQEDNVVKE